MPDMNYSVTDISCVYNVYDSSGNFEAVAILLQDGIESFFNLFTWQEWYDDSCEEFWYDHCRVLTGELSAFSFLERVAENYYEASGSMYYGRDSPLERPPRIDMYSIDTYVP